MTPGPTRPAGEVSAGHGRSAPDACSVQFDHVGLSAYGTAARAGFWLALEQDGPWGRVAATESHLPPAIGQELDAACASRGGRFVLLRRPGRHADAHQHTGHTAYLAFSGTRPWLLAVQDAPLEQIAAVDLDALARGDQDAVRAGLPGAEAADPVLLVCTNGRRDVCCAVRGRPVALEAGAAAPGRVWESSHTGGHRFAPTGVVLPFGATLARLDAAGCGEVLDAALAARLPDWALGPVHDRGRSTLTGAAQAAESWVRSLIGETSLTALTTTAAVAGAPHGPSSPSRDGGGDGEDLQVAHTDGRQWVVTARQVAAGSDLRESCGKTAIPTRTWHLSLK